MLTNTSNVREYKNLINGEWVTSSDSKETIERRSPATGKVVAQYPAGTKEDTLKAISMAKDAFEHGPWPRISGLERSRVLNRLAQLVRENLERLAIIEVEEVGKPIREARADIEGCIGQIEYAAGLAQQLHGESYNNLGEKHTALVVKEPVGVVGIITPWNFPALIYCQKMPFALAAGCTIVAKPSEFTSGTTLEISRLAEEAGVPKGVINVVTGLGGSVGQVLIDSPDIDHISFTGSTITGQKIMKGSAEFIKKVSLELGGKGANVVFSDANIEDAIDGTLFGVFYNQGEVCCATSRLIIEDSIADEFLEKLIKKAQKLKVGNPMEEDTDIGALIHEGHARKVLQYVESGRQEGAVLLTGGKYVDSSENKDQFFVEPTIFDRVHPSMKIFQEEIFGPVLSVTRFKTLEEGIALANQTSYGLSNAVWTKDLDKALVVSRSLQSGQVWVNSMIATGIQLPFGGYKGSGIGRELGINAVEEFTETKAINIHLGKRDLYYQ